MSTRLHAAVSGKSKKKRLQNPLCSRSKPPYHQYFAMPHSRHISLNRHLELIINFMAHASAVYVLFAFFKMSIDHDIKHIVGVRKWFFFRFHVWQQKEIKNFIFSMWFSCLEPLTNRGMKLTREKTEIGIHWHAQWEKNQLKGRIWH